LRKTYLLEKLKASVKRIGVLVVVGLLLLIPILPQLVLAAPEISDVSVTDITGTTATITWTTNIASDSRVNYGTTTALGDTEDDDAEVTNHFIPLTGLSPDTIYYFEVISGSERSPLNPSEYYSFKTLTPTTYSITLDHACGVCGELIDVKTCGEVIGVTAIVAAAGTYYICWDSRTAWDSTKATGAIDTFTATGAGSHTSTFYMPEAKKGIHTVYLVDNTYAEKAKADFEVGPSVKIEPDEGPVDTQVTLNGYGFDNAQDIRVTLFQDEVKKGEEKTATANDKGSWTASYSIPATPGGGYAFKVEAKEGTVWVNWVSKYFKVTPEITVNNNSSAVGKTIKISGTGFASKEKGVEVTFDEEVVKTNIPVDENGSWSVWIAVPPLQSGTYTIGASGDLTRARDVDDIEDFIVNAGILVEPTSAHVGDKITVDGGGFAPGETGIQVYFDGQIVTSSIITADKDGCWQSSFFLPASTYGDNTVKASGDITKPAVTTTLNTKARIEERSPDEGAPGDYISLTGSGFNGGQRLTVTVSGVGVTENLQTQPNGDVIITFRVPKGSIEGTGTLVVTDEGGATDSVGFTVTKKTLSTTPLAISPKDSTLRSGMVTFRWQGMPSGSDFTYILQISETAAFTSIFQPQPGIEESSYTLTEEEALPKGTYYWRVKIVDDYGSESAWSDTIEFRVSPIPTWVWVVVGVVVLVVLMVVAYRETKFKVTE